MKTKIKTISPDQNIIEHESGLRTVFVDGGKCSLCSYSGMPCPLVPCYPSARIDKLRGMFIKSYNHETNRTTTN